MRHIRVDWTQISHIQSSTQLDDLLREYLFKEELGTVKKLTELKGFAKLL